MIVPESSSYNRPFQITIGKVWDMLGNPTICFVCDPLFQIRKNSSLFGTLGHNSYHIVFVMAWNWKCSAEVWLKRSIVESSLFGTLGQNSYRIVFVTTWNRKRSAEVWLKRSIVEFEFVDIFVFHISTFQLYQHFPFAVNFCAENWLLCCDLGCKWVTCRSGWKRLWKRVLHIMQYTCNSILTI